MVKKCEEEPKLFYKYINAKTKTKETIDKIVTEGKTYQTEEEISEIMNTSFKKVFTEEEDFEEPDLERLQGRLQEVRV